MQWIDGLNHPVIQSSHHPIILLANEFLDALPLEQWQFVDGAWRERVVEVNAQGLLSFAVSEKRKGAAVHMTGRQGDIFECAPAREKFVSDVARILKSRRGAALFIDYGHEGGIGDTLQAVKNHKFAPVLDDVGNADLTSHVDFAALKSAVQEQVAVFGPVGQGAFLERLGIRERAQKLKQVSELERLTATTQMGRLFKAMALCHDVILEGF